MTTINIRNRNSKGMQLNGNVLSGDTYPIKDFIKARCGGKWDSNIKAWIVDAEKVIALIDGGSSTIYRDDAPVASAPITHNHTGLCPKCHTYCYGDCTAN